MLPIHKWSRASATADAFPIGIFLFYVVSTGGQAIYSTYLNLYLSSAGLSQPQIGMTVSVSTFFVLFAQMFWGFAGDRAKYKNTVVSVMCLASAVAAMLFHASTAYWFVMAVIVLYACCHNGIYAVMDSITMEAGEGKRWNYGQIRSGGTIGYCLTVLFIGFLIGERYDRIFVMSGAAMFICFLLSARVPLIRGHRSGKAAGTPLRALLRSKPLLAVSGLYLCFSIGVSFFYSFYPIYFRSLGGSSAGLGVMMFFCAVTEIPCLMVVDRAINRFGLNKVLIVSGLITCVRWLLLFLIKAPWVVMAVSMLHGPGYVAYMCGTIRFISRHVPKDLRASGQSFLMLIGKIIPQILFGYLGGLASEAWGANYVILAAGALLLLAVTLFALWSARKPALLDG